MFITECDKIVARDIYSSHNTKIGIINMKHTARKKRIRPAIVLILLDFMIFPLIVYK